MSRIRRIVTSSIGKKWLMSLSGLSLVGFLLVHLAGNLTILLGTNAFNNYAERLHSVGPLLSVAELGLLLIGLLHIIYATTVVLENLRARPKRYAVKQSEGGRSIASRTMLITGPYILLFVLFHLAHFTFSSSEMPISTVVAARFADPVWAAFYAFSMAVVGTHVSHGLWSGFQSLGVETLRKGNLRTVGLVVSLALGVGFGLLPIVVYSTPNLLQ